jgi:hypothetical protein
MPNLNGESELLAPSLQPLEEIAIERTQWSDVDYGDALSIFDPQQLIQDWKEDSLSLPGTCRCNEKDISSADNLRNGYGLRWSWGSKSGLKSNLLDFWRQEREDLLRQSPNPALTAL